MYDETHQRERDKPGRGYDDLSLRVLADVRAYIYMSILFDRGVGSLCENFRVRFIIAKFLRHSLLCAYNFSL